MAPNTNSSKKKVAVIGSGISGCSCAFLLSDKYDVTVFEPNGAIGMDSHSLDINLSSSKEQPEMVRIGAPPRAINDPYYKNLLALYRHAGVPLIPFDWTSSFSQVTSGSSKKILDYFTLNFSTTNFILPRFIWEYTRFMRKFKQDYPKLVLTKKTVGQYAQELGISHLMMEKFILPILAMICTCSFEQCLNYPAHLIVEFANVSPGTKFRVRDGAEKAGEKLLEKVALIRSNTRVVQVQRATSEQNKVLVIYQYQDEQSAKKEMFDHVVMTCPSFVSLKLLQGSTLLDQKILDQIPHVTSRVVIHKDFELVPKKKKKLPAHFTIGSDKKEAMCTLVFDLPNHQSVLQTWNPTIEPKQDKILADFTFQRPIVTLESLDAIRQIHQLQGNGNVWFAGAYSLETIPLQESGATSAVHIARALGVQVPWRCTKNLANLDQFYSSSSLFTSAIASTLMCLGLWQETNGTSIINSSVEAKDALAKYVGYSIGLKSNDKVVMVGQSDPSSLENIVQEFDLGSLTVIEPLQSLKQTVPKSDRIQVYQQDFLTTTFLSNQSVSHVLCLEKGYQFTQKKEFYEEAFRLLKPNGKLAMVDLTFKWSNWSYLIVSFFNGLLRIPLENQKSLVDKEASIVLAGFAQVRKLDLSSMIFPGLWKYVVFRHHTKKKSLLQWLSMVSMATGLRFLYACGLIDCHLIQAIKL